MKTFMKDYKDLCKNTGAFYKKHWKGAILLNAAIVGAEMAWFNRRRIKDSIESKFNKNEEEA